MLLQQWRRTEGGGSEGFLLFFDISSVITSLPAPPFLHLGPKKSDFNFRNMAKKSIALGQSLLRVIEFRESLIVSEDKNVVLDSLVIGECRTSAPCDRLSFSLSSSYARCAKATTLKISSWGCRKLGWNGGFARHG